MKTYVTHSGTQAQGLRDGTISLLVIPILKLPAHYVKGKKPQQYGPAAFAFLDMADPIGTYPTCCVCPYAPGDEIGVKEVWGIARNDHGHRCLCYRADGDDHAELQMMLLWDQAHGRWTQKPTRFPNWTPDRWRSASKMPDYAIRTRVVCQSVEGRQLQGITEEEARRFYWNLCPRMESWSGMAYEEICGERTSDARWLGPLIDEWDRRHPDRPWAGNSWAWFVTVERKEQAVI